MSAEDQKVLAAMDARDQACKEQLERIGQAIGYGRAIQLLGQAWDNMMQASYPGMGRHQESMHRRSDIEKIEAGEPLARQVVYFQKRGRQGKITALVPMDMSLKNVRAIESETALYGRIPYEPASSQPTDRPKPWNERMGVPVGAQVDAVLAFIHMKAELLEWRALASSQPTDFEDRPLKARVLRNELAILLGCDDGRTSEQKADAVLRWIEHQGKHVFVSASSQPTEPAADVRARVLDAVADNLRGLYYCNRVWSAWSVGTMGEDDFSPAEEDDDVIANITNAVMATLAPASSQPTDGGVRK